MGNESERKNRTGNNKNDEKEMGNEGQRHIYIYMMGKQIQK